MKLSGHTILITGGTSGIGYQLAKSLQSGNHVILLGRNKNKLHAAEKEGFDVIPCDLGNMADIEQAVTRIENEFPELDMLYNNAGVQRNYLYTESGIAPVKIQEEVTANLTGPMMLTQLLIPLLRNKNAAWIINTSSGLGAFPKADGIVYSAAKAGIRNFTTGLRYALKNTGIRVMEWIPPVTDTPMTSGRDEKKMDAAALIRLSLPQMEQERKIITTPQIRFFLLIAYFFPGLANRILSKK